MSCCRVLFICKKRISTYGVSYGLSNSAQFISNYLNELPSVESKVVFAQDGNEIDKLVTEYNACYVILEAIWTSPSKMQELLNIPRHQNRQWIIRIHSKLSFLAHEGMAIKWLYQLRDICDNMYMQRKYNFVTGGLYIAPNTPEFCVDLVKVMGFHSNDVVYLPNIYYPEKLALNPNNDML